MNGFLKCPEITLTNLLHDKQVYFQVVLVSPLIDGCTFSFCRKKGENIYELFCRGYKLCIYITILYKTNENLP